LKISPSESANHASHRRCAAILVLILGWVAVPSRADPPSLLTLASIRPDRILSLKTESQDWYKDAVVYHLWVAAFRDSDNDGVGDLKGVIQGLDSLKDLGVTCLWLSPFFKSSSTPRNLHVTMWSTITPSIPPRHERRCEEPDPRGPRPRHPPDFRFAPNHISSRHPGLSSRATEVAKTDWFVWRDTRPEKGWTGFDKSSDWHAADGRFTMRSSSAACPT